MSTLLLTLIAWIPFVHPIRLPPSLRLWMFVPLALLVALVYRASRSIKVSDMPRGTLITFINIVVGMWALALAAYGVHQCVLYFSST